MGAPRRPGREGESQRGQVLLDTKRQGFGHRLKSLRDRADITQEEVAKRVSHALANGTSYGTASAGGWENNLWVPPVHVIAAAARVFECDPGWLAFGTLTEARSPDTKEREDAIERFGERITAVVEQKVGKTAPRRRPADGPRRLL